MTYRAVSRRQRRKWGISKMFQVTPDGQILLRLRISHFGCPWPRAVRNSKTTIERTKKSSSRHPDGSFGESHQECPSISTIAPWAQAAGRLRSNGEHRPQCRIDEPLLVVDVGKLLEWRDTGQPRSS
jgi:hypothetical protein